MIIGKRMTNPGDLRVQISLQTKTLTKGDDGAQSPVYTTIATVWAAWENDHGEEVIIADAMRGKVGATVLIRYRSDVNHNTVILKGSERYEVLSPDNIRNRGEYIELKVRKVTGTA